MFNLFTPPKTNMWDPWKSMVASDAFPIETGPCLGDIRSFPGV